MIGGFNSTGEYIIDIDYQHFSDLNEKNAIFTNILKIIAVFFWSILSITGLIGFYLKIIF